VDSIWSLQPNTPYRLPVKGSIKVSLSIQPALASELYWLVVVSQALQGALLGLAEMANSKGVER
jgi:hypothetical protein